MGALKPELAKETLIVATKCKFSTTIAKIRRAFDYAIHEWETSENCEECRAEAM